MRVLVGNRQGDKADVEGESPLLHHLLRGNHSMDELCLVNRNPIWNTQVGVFALFLHDERSTARLGTCGWI